MRAPEHVLVIGTRPEAIKCAPLVSAFARRGLRDRLLVVFSGQQIGLLESACTPVEADVRLADWPHGKHLREQREVMVERLTMLFKELGGGPLLHVIVQGDTSTAYFAALAATRTGAQLHHIEAGLRSGAIANPFPEEFHRRAITRMARMHYAPTASARTNLLREGVRNSDILTTGNTGIDSLVGLLPRADPDQQRDTILITLHRQENRGAAVHALMHALQDLAPRFPALHFIWVRHTNPAITRELDPYGTRPLRNLHIVSPMPHAEMIAGSDRYALIMTDSGGLQEEATHLGIPLMILRDRTERPEALRPDHGVLCPPTELHHIAVVFNALIRNARRPDHAFGSGNASERILDRLLSALVQ